MHAEEEGVLKLERGEQALFLAQAAQRFELLVHGVRFQEIMLDLRELFHGEGHVAIHRAEAAAVVTAPLRARAGNPPRRADGTSFPCIS